MPETLRIGSQGPAVSDLQTKLNASAKPNPPLDVDGIFGPKTEGAARQFQRMKGLGVDGIVGPKTWEALGGTATGVLVKSEPPPAPVPILDGQVSVYSANEDYGVTPKIYYVNGIQTDAKTHGETLKTLSILTEHEITGIYNRSGGVGKWYGFVIDLKQCLDDWGSNVGHKLAETANKLVSTAINKAIDALAKKFGNAPPTDPVNIAGSIRQAVPEKARLWLIETRLKTYNEATASLFRQLSDNYGQRTIIVAHSQGNLIVSDALWAMVLAYGEDSLVNMVVRSLASPSPAWPLGIRHQRKVYGHTNDIVTLADPHNWSIITERLFNGEFGRSAGDWRKYGDKGVGIEPHKIELNMFELNFANRIRDDVGLPPISDYPEPPK